jgi:hypothetical protein
VLADLLGFQQTARDKQSSVDPMNISVFKIGPNRRSTAVEFESVSSIARLNRVRSGDSPFKLVALPPQWAELCALLADATEPAMLVTIFTSVVHSMRDKHSNSVWALSVLEILLARKEHHDIPPQLIESILDMCVVNKDLYSILEILALVRERGIPVSEGVWGQVMEVAGRGGARHMNGLTRDRVFAQVVDLIKRCRGQLDGDSVAVLMRFLFFKKDAQVDG